MNQIHSGVFVPGRTQLLHILHFKYIVDGIRVEVISKYCIGCYDFQLYTYEHQIAPKHQRTKGYMWPSHILGKMMPCPNVKPKQNKSIRGKKK